MSLETIVESDADENLSIAQHSARSRSKRRDNAISKTDQNLNQSQFDGTHRSGLVSVKFKKEGIQNSQIYPEENKSENSSVKFTDDKGLLRLPLNLTNLRNSASKFKFKDKHDQGHLSLPEPLNSSRSTKSEAKKYLKPAKTQEVSGYNNLVTVEPIADKV